MSLSAVPRLSQHVWSSAKRRTRDASRITRFVALIVCLSCAGAVFAGAGKIPISPTTGGYARESTSTPPPSPLDVSGSFTVEAWINPTDMIPRPIFSDSQYDVWTYQTSSAFGIRFTLYNTDGTYSYAIQNGLLLNTWNHIAASYDASSNSCLLAINGVATLTASCTSGTPDRFYDQLFGVGIDFAGSSSGAAPGSQRFAGSISEIRMSKGLRYTGAYTPAKCLANDSNTVGLWHVDDAPGSTTLTDSSATGRALFAIGTSAAVGGPRACDGRRVPVVAGDFGPDDKSDILWRRASDGQVLLWTMNGLQTSTITNIGGPSVDWTVVAVGDFNGDGKNDMLWRQTSTGMVQMWLLDGLTLTNWGNFFAGTDWTVAAVGDFDGDGKTDILWRQTSTGLVQMWLMDGLTVKSWANIGSGTDWSIAAVGDFNGDGRADILWRQRSTGIVEMWLMNGLAMTNWRDIGANPDMTVVGVGDFDIDGHTDILWRQTSTGVVQVAYMNGLNETGRANIGSGVDWTIVGVGDFNGDGKPDLIWRQSNGNMELWLMDGAFLKSSRALGTPAMSVLAPK